MILPEWVLNDHAATFGWQMRNLCDDQA